MAQLGAAGEAELPPPRGAQPPHPSLQFSCRTQGGNLSPCESRSQPRLLPRLCPLPGAALPGLLMARGGDPDQESPCCKALGKLGQETKM